MNPRLLASLLAGCAALAPAQTKKAMEVEDFDYSTVMTAVQAIFGTQQNIGQGIQAMLVFMVLYMVDVTGFFACLAALSRQGRSMETIDDMAGLIKEQPGIALAMTAFSLSALGRRHSPASGPRCMCSRPRSAPASPGPRSWGWWARSWPRSTICA